MLCSYVGHHGDKAKRQFEDPAFFQELSEYVLTAERSLMYTLSFTLQVEHPYSVIFRALKAMTESSDPKVRAFGHRHLEGRPGGRDSSLTVLFLARVPSSELSERSCADMPVTQIMNNFISNIYTSQHYPVLLYDLRHIAYCAIRLTFKLRGVEVA